LPLVAAGAVGWISSIFILDCQMPNATVGIGGSVQDMKDTGLEKDIAKI
jgi:hypothetical protein